jgi:predicted DNA-binding protein
MPDDLHQRLKKLAKEKKMPVNTFINMLVEEVLGEDYEDLKARVERLEKEVFGNKKED